MNKYSLSHHWPDILLNNQSISYEYHIKNNFTVFNVYIYDNISDLC